MEFDHQRDETAGFLRLIEALLAIFGTAVLGAFVVIYSFFT